MNALTKRIIKHVAFWGGYVCFDVALAAITSGDVAMGFIIATVALPVKIMVTYYYIYFLLPKYLLPKRYIAFVLLLLGGFVAAALLQRAIQFYVFNPLFSPEHLDEGFFVLFRMVYNLMEINLVAGVVSFIKLLQYSHASATEKLNTELKFLKAQIHPHFLFNTLNNLYGLSLIRSEKTPEIILKLSEFLRYILYECNADLVSLKREVEMIRHYIALEQIRFSGKVTISFEVTGTTEGKEIAPLLFLPLVENCFKHGIQDSDDTNWIKFHLDVSGSPMRLKIENSLPSRRSEAEPGLGLVNLRSRLALIYPGRHSLIIQALDTFLVTLEI